MRTATLVLASSIGLLGCLGADDADTGALQQSQGCLDHSDDEYRVRLDGVELAAHDGATVHVVTDLPLAFTPDHRCTVSARGQVDGGGFVVEMSNRTDGAAYPVVGAFIDVDDDGACSPGVDLEWHIVGSVAPGAELALTVGPDDFAAGAELGVCPYFDE